MFTTWLWLLNVHCSSVVIICSSVQLFVDCYSVSIKSSLLECVIIWRFCSNMCVCSVSSFLTYDMHGVRCVQFHIICMILNRFQINKQIDNRKLFRKKLARCSSLLHAWIGDQHQISVIQYQDTLDNDGVDRLWFEVGVWMVKNNNNNNNVCYPCGGSISGRVGRIAGGGVGSGDCEIVYQLLYICSLRFNSFWKAVWILDEWEVIGYCRCCTTVQSREREVCDIVWLFEVEREVMCDSYCALLYDCSK